MIISSIQSANQSNDKQLTDHAHKAVNEQPASFDQLNNQSENAPNVSVPIIQAITGCSVSRYNPNITVNCEIGMSPLTIYGLNFRTDVVPQILVNQTICAVDPRSRRSWPVCIVSSISHPPNFDYSRLQSVRIRYQGGEWSAPFDGVMFKRPNKLSSSSTARNQPQPSNQQADSDEMTLAQELGVVAFVSGVALIFLCCYWLYRRHQRRSQLAFGVDERLIEHPNDQLVDRAVESGLYQPALATMTEQSHSPDSPIVTLSDHVNVHSSNIPTMYSTEEGQPHVASFDAVQAQQNYLYAPMIRSWWHAPS